MMSDLPSNPQRSFVTRAQLAHGLGNGAAPPDPEADGPGMGEYLGALRRHLWLVLLASVLGVGLAGFAVYRTETLYSSKAVVQFVEERATPTGGLAGLAATLGGGGSSFTSQVQVVRSRIVLGQVVDSLGLRLQRKVPGMVRSEFHPTGVVSEVRVSPDATADTLRLSFLDDRVHVRSGDSEATAAYAEPVEIDGVRLTVPDRPVQEELTLWVIPREEATDELLESVKVFAREGTNIVDIFATGYDPAITQRVANTTAELYKRFVSRRSREQAQRRRAFVANQLVVAESLLATTQQELADFRKREALYSSKAKAMVEQTGGHELELARAQLGADRQVYAAFLSEIQRTGGKKTASLHSILSSPNILANPVVMGLYEKLTSYESQRDSLTLGPKRNSATNPDVRGLDSLIILTEGRLVGAVRSNIESLDARIAAMNEIQARTDSTMRHIAATEPEELRLMLRMESVSEAAKGLRERYYTAGMVEAAELDQVTVLDPALEGELAGSGPLRTLLLGLVFGLMVGGAGAVVVDRANRSIRKREELEHLLRVPGLAVIPRLAPGAERRLQIRLPGGVRNGNGRVDAAVAGASLVAATRVHSLGAEAYRTLRTNLIFSPELQSLRSIVVTSPSGLEGKTTTASNLAIAFAQKGMRVLLVDCDLRRPGLHTLFGVPREPGLSQLLRGEAAVEEVVRVTDVERLTVLPAGPFPSVSATDLLDGGVMRSLIDALAADFDLVILDTPPVLATANAAVLGTQVDGVVLVVRAGQTDRDAARQALQQLAAVGARVVGAVLNDPDARVPHRRTDYDEEPALAEA
jgi:capsular exopolysaccharide synthesis family protein